MAEKRNSKSESFLQSFPDAPKGAASSTAVSTKKSEDFLQAFPDDPRAEQVGRTGEFISELSRPSEIGAKKPFDKFDFEGADLPIEPGTTRELQIPASMRAVEKSESERFLQAFPDEPSTALAPIETEADKAKITGAREAIQAVIGLFPPTPFPGQAGQDIIGAGLGLAAVSGEQLGKLEIEFGSGIPQREAAPIDTETQKVTVEDIVESSFEPSVIRKKTFEFARITPEDLRPGVFNDPAIANTPVIELAAGRFGPAIGAIVDVADFVIAESRAGLAFDLAAMSLSQMVNLANLTRGATKERILKIAINRLQQSKKIAKKLKLTKVQRNKNVAEVIKRIKKRGEQVTLEAIVEGSFSARKFTQGELAFIDDAVTETLVDLAGDFKIIKGVPFKKQIKRFSDRAKKNRLEDIDTEDIRGTVGQIAEEIKFRKKVRLLTAKKGSVTRELLRETRGQLNKMGPAGKELVRVIDEAILESEITGGILVTDVFQILDKFDEAGQEIVGALLDKTRRAKFTARSTPEHRKAAQQIRIAFRPLIKKLRALGVVHVSKGGKAKDLLDENDLFTHFLNFDEQSQLEAIVRKVAKNHPSLKGLKNNDDRIIFALDIVRKYRGKMSTRTSGTFENSKSLSKLGITEFNKNTKEVLRGTIASWSKRASEAKHFGEGDSKILNQVDGLIDQLQRDGFDSKFAKLAFEQQFIGKPSTQLGEGARTAMSNIKAFNIFTKLGLAQIRNAQQTFTNTIPRTNLTSTLQAIREVVKGTSSTRFNDMATNIILQSQKDILRDAVGMSIDDIGKGVMTSEQFMKFTRFATVELYNRLVGMNAGRFYALELAEVVQKTGGRGINGRMAIRRLSELGIPTRGITTALKTGKVADDNLVRAGLKVVADSQFRTGTLDLPLFWKSDVGRMTTQFKTFMFRQAVFVKKSIIDEANRGNLKPLANWIAMAELAGIPSQSAIDILRGKSSEDILAFKMMEDIKDFQQGVDGAGAELAKDLWRGFAAAGSFGIFLNMVTEAFPEWEGRKVAPGLRGVSFAFGPATDVPVAIVDAARFGIMPSAKSAGRVLRRVPIIGPALERAIDPDKQTIIGEIFDER